MLTFVGKYPQLLIACASKPYDRYTEATLDFDCIPVGTSVVKNVEIFNMARVSGTNKFIQLSIACICMKLTKFLLIFILIVDLILKVEAKCTIEHLKSLSAVDKVFSCAVTRVIVPPMSSEKLQVNFILHNL